MPVSEVRGKSRFGLTRDGIYRKSILVTCTSSYYIIMTINATCLNIFIWASHTLIPLELTCHSIQAFLTLSMVKNCKVHQLMRHSGQSQVVSQKMVETLQTLPLLCTEFHENYKDNILNVVLKLSQESHVIAIIQRFALYLENTKQTQGQHSIYYLCSFHGTTCKRGHIVCKTTWASLVWRSQSWNHVTTNM